MPKAVTYNLTGEHHLHIGTQPLATHLAGPEAADTSLVSVPLGEDHDAEYAAYPLLCRMQFHPPAPVTVHTATRLGQCSYACMQLTEVESGHHINDTSTLKARQLVQGTQVTLDSKEDNKSTNHKQTQCGR